jgi:PAS domain S-box-containing protein
MKDPHQIIAELETQVRELAAQNEALRNSQQHLKARQENEEAARNVLESFEYWLGLFANFPSLIWLAGVDGKCSYVNDTWLEFTGCTLEQELGDGWVERIHPADRERSFAIYLDAYARKVPFEMECRLRYHDGSYRWIIDCGRPFTSPDGAFAGYIGSCHDLTMQKQADFSRRHMVKERDRLLTQLELILCNMPDGCIMTTTDFTVSYWNNAATSIFGFERTEVLHKQLFSDAIPIEVHDAAGKEKPGEWLENSPAVRMKDNLTKDGQLIHCEWHITQIADENGMLSGYIFMVRDATWRMQAEEALSMTQTRLIQADKMATLGILVSGIAHEINNPNNFIMFNSGLLNEAWQSAMPILEEYYRDNGEFNLGDFQYSSTRDIIPRLFSGLEEGAHRIKNIVERLKNFARQNTVSKTEKVDINKVVFDAIAMLSHEIQTRCENFHLSACDDLPQAKCNAQQIEQVLMNLLMNALQSLPHKRCGIRVATFLAAGETELAISIEDEGVGMTPEVLARINEPFFTTRSDLGGTGLGLSITASILKENLGQLLFDSESGSGTKATVLLPVYQQELP